MTTKSINPSRRHFFNKHTRHIQSIHLARNFQRSLPIMIGQKRISAQVTHDPSYLMVPSSAHDMKKSITSTPGVVYSRFDHLFIFVHIQKSTNLVLFAGATYFPERHQLFISIGIPRDDLLLLAIHCCNVLFSHYHPQEDQR